MASTFSIESAVEAVMDRRDMSADFLSLIAAMYNINGASQSRISQALRGAKAFNNEHEPLRALVQDIDEFCRSLEPIPVLLKRPAIIKPLLDEFITKKKQEQALIRPVFIIEFDNQELFQGFVDGECRRILHGDFRKGAGKIWDSERPHVIPGSAVEALIQKFNPDFHGAATSEFQQANEPAINKPLVQTSQFIDKKQHPVQKAIAEARGGSHKGQHAGFLK
jgi:hypothetical protein